MKYKELYGNNIYEDGTIVSHTGHKMTPQLSKKGYATVQVYWDKGVRQSYFVHRLVAEAFLGERPDDHEINHKDCIRNNNHIDNLEYVTRKYNREYSYSHGLRNVDGTNNANCKHSEDTIHKICKLIEDTALSNSQIAAVTGVSRTTVGNIRRGRQWRTVSNKYNFSSTFRD